MYRRLLVFILMGLLMSGVAGCQLFESTTDSEAEPEAEMPARPFFVQVATTDSRNAAEQAREQVVSWWHTTDARPDALPDTNEPPVRIVWQAPYYRVRLGPLPSRNDAAAVRDALPSSFDGAFIARGAP